MKITILLYEGFDELDAVGPFEVFRHAARLGAPLEVSLATLGEVAEVRASGGLRVRPDGMYSGRPDLVLVPGGGWSGRADRGTWGEAQRGQIPQLLKQLNSQGTTIATVCTGGMLAAAAGLTRGRPAITHRAAIDDLRASGAEVVDARVVDDGDLLMAGGVTSGIDLALWIVEREFGASIADAVTELMEYPRSREIWRRDVQPARP